ncbi:Enoyl-CoA hydratase domain-containing protein 1 [Sarcoptes scabiei]|nr:Enoyl-CoA hydratase domain-containing protein 1 [Sarcoptes scabiei]
MKTKNALQIFLLITNMLNSSANFLTKNSKSIETVLNYYSKEISPNRTRLILRNIRMNCRRVIANQFLQCSSRFENESLRLFGRELNWKSYENKWNLCCAIYRHQQCLMQSLRMNSLHSMMLCDENDCAIGQAILDQTNPNKITEGFCPPQHMEYKICNAENNWNIFTSIVLMLGSISLMISIVFAGLVH